MGVWTETPESLKATTPIVDAVGLARHEVLRRRLGRVHPRRREVGGGHAGGDVEGEDDRALLARQVDDRLRPGQRDGHHGQPDQEQRRRNPAAHACRPARGPAPEPQTAAGLEAAAAPAVQGPVQQGTDRDQRQRSSIGGQMNDIAYLRRRRRIVAMRTMARTRSSSVESDSASTPARPKAPFTSASRRRAASLEAAAESGVVGVDVELLAGLGVLHDQRADVGQLDLARVEQPDGDDLVAPVEQAQRPLPARAR